MLPITHGQAVQLINKYLAPEQAKDVQRLLKGKSVKIKYKDYDWSFRGFHGRG